MPIYEYECTKCGESFNLIRRLSDNDNEIKCPKCNLSAAKRVLSTFATKSSDSICTQSAPSGST
ncbi:zinc ribbon domain-containing protein [Chloroflexota bacterium]